MSSSTAAPKLHEVTSDMLDSFTSRSAPVIARAQQCHNEEMRRLKLPWWKKLWDEDAVDLTGEKPRAQKEEQLNFWKRYFLLHGYNEDRGTLSLRTEKDEERRKAPAKCKETIFLIKWLFQLIFVGQKSTSCQSVGCRLVTFQAGLVCLLCSLESGQS